MEKLTGNISYRTYKPLFHKPMLVLQVEIEYKYPVNAGSHIEVETCKTYIDAEVKHLIELKVAKKC